MLIMAVFQIYIFIVFATVILSWLVAFNVVNTQNRFVYIVGDFLYRVTEPLLRPIRSFMPNLGGLDIAPVVLLLVLYFIRSLVVEYWPN
jgi:YggT family protein